MTKWLVISNCQTRGLTHSLALQAPGIEVEACDIRAYRKEHDHWSARLPEYARIVINAEFYGSELKPETAGMDVTVVPQIYFPGYHPDETVLLVDGAPVDSSIGAYHSLIAYTAFGRGLSAAQTAGLYRRETYLALDYLGWWSRWHHWLIKVFAEYEFDISGAFNRWSRGRAFMYTSHHPRVECLYDMAGLILSRHGLTPERPNCLPDDHLLSDVCFPVYSEIATGLGFEGSYQFKPRNSLRCIDLESFIAQSFAIYETLDLSKVVIEDNRRPLLEALASL